MIFRSRQELPLAGVLLVVAVGFVLLLEGFWRRGSLLIAAALLLGAVLRLLLPDPQAGLLGVRGRWTDVVVLVLLATVVTTLAVWVPAA